MDTVPVRVKKEIHHELKALAERLGKSMQVVFQEALEAYRRQRFFDELDAKVIFLKKDKRAWREELEERKAWEATLADGLEPEPRNIPKARKKVGGFHLHCPHGIPRSYLKAFVKHHFSKFLLPAPAENEKFSRDQNESP